MHEIQDVRLIDGIGHGLEIKQVKSPALLSIK